MSRSAATALTLGALLLSACGPSAPRLQRLPPAEMREILPPPGVAAAPATAPAPDVLPAVAGAGAAAGLQVAPGAAPIAPPPTAAAANAGAATTRAPTATPATPPAATGPAVSPDFAISLATGDGATAPTAASTPSAAPATAGAATTRAPTATPATPPAATGPAVSPDFGLSLATGDGATAPTAAATPSAARAPVDEAGWPRSFTATGVAFEVHEPQVQRWDGSVLVAYAAVVAHPDGQRQAAPGVVRIKANTVVDKAAGTVAVNDLTLTDASFPTARDRESAWLDLLRNFAPRSVKRLSLAHLEASARQAQAIAQGAAAAQPATPRIIVARNPALLVPIDGDPRFVQLPGTRLQGARNTRVVLLKDTTGKLYLRVYNGWLSATSLRGPWAIAEEPPGAVSALQAARASGRANLLTGKPNSKTGKLPTLSKNNVPQIVVATQPAILVGVSGEPKFAPIPGTSLEYVTNTAAHIFRDTSNQRIYVLAGTRWFQGTAARGTFDLTPTTVDKLPADIARIPASGPKGAVAPLAKAGGAPAAAPAAEPPLPAIVAAPRSKARFDVVINGDPQLQPIRGTELNYVANASAPIIQVDINNWYGEQNGVWFKAPDATGPWSVTDQVPPEIYQIPPSVPIYHAIHSRVFASTADTVYYGYTPDSEHMGPTGGATGVSVEGEDYQTTPAPGLMWGWFY